MTVDPIDREILVRVQDGIPIEERPFAGIAEALSIGETEVVERLAALRRAGVVRRFGSRVHPRRAGISVHAMVAWKVPPESVRAVGTAMARHPEVTHCYERTTCPGRWEYNLYTVLHGHEMETVTGHIRDLARETGIDEYLVLPSTREYKRVATGRIREGP